MSDLEIEAGSETVVGSKVWAAGLSLGVAEFVGGCDIARRGSGAVVRGDCGYSRAINAAGEEACRRRGGYRTRSTTTGPMMA